ncbi:MAG: HAMP domain-containing protein [Ideonella sp.]|nr:HAMP domain-containing protein [Ideonella sp.]
MQRWLPRTLFGRLMVVLATGLLLAQLLSAGINLAERDRLLSDSFGMQPAQRIADVVKLLDALAPAEREQLVALFRLPPLVLSLAEAPLTAADAAGGLHARMFATHLQFALGGERAVRVQSRDGFAPGPGSAGSGAWRRGGQDAPGMGPGFGPRMGQAGGPASGPGMGMGMSGLRRGAALPVLRTEVQLRDGRWARFDTELPAAPQTLPIRLALTLAVLLASVLALSYVAVRWVVQPLQRLTDAAEALGQDLDRPPLSEDGPREVQRAARAFNTMQQRLSGFVNERTRMLTALSHDLKTPLTRMRLRAELMDDDEQRARFEADLLEMEAMVTQTLEFMRGLGGNEPRAPVDMNALLAALQTDNAAMGRSVRIEGQAHAPVLGNASLLKRALGNLVDNAVLYGGAATVQVENAAGELRLRVLDDGPGIAEAELQRVFEPFHRLEASRNRATGGTGLGLGIARSIARAHGGEVVLMNRPEGGLEARLSLSHQGH